jgi:hypothetical protein
MGNYQAQPVDGPSVPLHSDLDAAQPESSVSGGQVRVTPPPVDVERAIKEAYDQGKADTQAQIQGMLESVAVEVYDNVHNQLRQIQSVQAEEAQKLVSNDIL